MASMMGGGAGGDFGGIDFSKLGGAGMGGGFGDESDDDDLPDGPPEDDVPALEGEEAEKAEGEAKVAPKIEEIN
jgi:hypothetical protein